MNEQTIRCPKCGNTIEITEAFSKEIEEKLRMEFNQKYKEEKTKLETKIKRQAEEDFNTRTKLLEEEIKEKSMKLQEANEKEKVLLKLQRQLEDDKQDIELSVQRRLNEESQKIRQEITAKLLEEFRQQEAQLNLRTAEKDKTITNLVKQIEELKRKAEQGSQQAQGEILELELENLLRSAFRYDDIEPVPKGIKGADVIQYVKNEVGSPCGAIIWEAKRTKAWSDAWIDKLKEHRREVKADVAVIVSTVLPKDMVHIGNINDVWVVDFRLAVSLAHVLRDGMFKIALAQNALIGKNEKMELVYTYLSGQEFRQRVEAIVEAFRNMKQDLDSEKRAMEKIWSKREQQINQVITNTSRMYGEIEGIIGKALPPIATLELPMNGGEE
jgi:hypothetical protein